MRRHQTRQILAISANHRAPAHFCRGSAESELRLTFRKTYRKKSSSSTISPRPPWRNHRNMTMPLLSRSCVYTHLLCCMYIRIFSFVCICEVATNEHEMHHKTLSTDRPLYLFYNTVVMYHKHTQVRWGANIISVELNVFTGTWLFHTLFE